MNGATTEPCARTSKPPSTTVMTMMGSSQNLRREPRNCQICITKSISNLLEHVPIAVVRRSGRGAVDPVARLRRLEAPAHRIAPQGPHHHADRRENCEEDDAQHERAHHFSH